MPLATIRLLTCPDMTIDYLKRILTARVYDVARSGCV